MRTIGVSQRRSDSKKKRKICGERVDRWSQLYGRNRDSGRSSLTSSFVVKGSGRAWARKEGMAKLVSRGCWSASAGARSRWTVGVDLLGFLHFFGGGRVVPVDAGLWFSLSVLWSARCSGGCVMSGDGGGKVRFPVGSVSGSAFGCPQSSYGRYTLPPTAST
jgi:hypothetical protein